ncbi:MAG: TIGR01777 family oxidoreductase [Simkaniaceae bacterium]|nr:TIGR01777 family oxidoreductase [Candidatus Sacchlamyda saccharinae]
MDSKLSSTDNEKTPSTQGVFFSSKKILVSGGGGFIGSELVSFLKKAGHEVLSLTRSKKRGEESIYWNPKSAEMDPSEFEGFDAVIHLAGKNISSWLWTKKHKNEVFLSRVRDSWLLSQILLRLKKPPQTLICASAIGIFGNRGDEKLNESSPPGTGFLAEVCKEWEESTSSIESKGVRVIHTRFGLVLSPKGGILAKLLPLFRIGLGAILGSGNQYVSWIALEDVVGGINHVLMAEELQGPVNFVSPNPVTNEEFSRGIAKALNKPLFLRIGEKPLQFFLGEMADEMFLASVRAYPEKLTNSGYEFAHPNLSSALFK